jgi:hypothetical protein
VNQQAAIEIKRSTRVVQKRLLTRSESVSDGEIGEEAPGQHPMSHTTTSIMGLGGKPVTNENQSKVDNKVIVNEKFQSVLKTLAQNLNGSKENVQNSAN